MKRLDPERAPLSGTQLVEASAGTGKTYTITTLVRRLIAERGLAPREILVVTYTRAATAELRERVRARLAEEAEAASCADQRRRLRAALRDLDEAAVFTIHGFCQRALAEHAFESGSDFGAEMLPHTQALLQEIVDDFWALQVYEAAAERVRAVQSERAGLLSLAARAAVDPDLRLVPPAPTCEPPDEEGWRGAQARCRDLWQAERDALLSLLRGAKLGLQRRWLEGWGAQMDEAVARGAPGFSAAFDKAERFSAAWLASKAADKGVAPPAHPFFDACEEWLTRDRAVLAYWHAQRLALRHELVRYTRGELARRTRARGLMTFDCLLRQLRDALQAPGGEALAQRLRARYRAVLIDEFQDTDPLQYAIFRRLFAGRPEPLLLIGDPKQAIYGFRGADIFAYLQARRDASDATHTLDTNYRSDPSLLAGVNYLFGRLERPFLLAGIDYHPVRPRPGAQDALPAGARAAVDILWAGPEAAGAQTKGDAQRSLPARVATDIVRLLSDGTTLARGGPPARHTPVRAADVAVLCRTNAQAALVQRALAERGVPTILHGDSSVFDSEDAAQLERLLGAMAQPGDARAVRSALATWYLGHTADDLVALEHDDSAWDAHRGLFARLHERWQRRGFYAAVRSLLRERAVEARLLCRPDGARRLTNLNHLLELLQQAAVGQRLGPLGLTHWLATMRADLAQRVELVGEAAQLRLETNDAAVTLTTVHRSKGLEYPIVYCPFLWDGQLLAQDDLRWLRFHDPDAQGQATLHLDGRNAERERALAEREALAENLRLLYVALTRAKHRVCVIWGHFQGAHTSALGYLLHGGGEPAARARAIKDADAAQLRDELASLIADSGGSLSLTALPEAREDRYTPPRPPAPTLRARTSRRTLRDSDRTSSFSALTSARETDAPGYDRDGAARPGLPTARPTTPAVPLASFPAGPLAGQLIHDVLERHDFQAGDQALDEAVAVALRQHGFDERWRAALCAGLSLALRTPLDEQGLCLASIATDQRLNELEFLFPVDRRRPLTPRALARLLRDHHAPGPAPGYAGAVAELGFEALSGFLRGFIDLAFVHDGRWYVVDYKSNLLGATAADYGPEALRQAMTEHHYFLQYYLYTVALHRYLRLRCPGYRYDTHFGGVYYLFLRGMAPDHPPGAGVYFERPRAEAIDALSARLSPDPPGLTEVAP